MKPPKCAVCNKKSRTTTDQFRLVRFRLTSEQRERNEKMKLEKIKGHPSGASWFCLDHLERAIMLKHMSNVEAIELIKEESQISCYSEEEE